MGSTVTVVLTASDAASDADLFRTLESLAAQSPPVEYELLCPVELDPGLIATAGLQLSLRASTSSDAPPDLRGCDAAWVVFVVAGDKWTPDRLARALADSDGVDVLYGDVQLAKNGRATGRSLGEFAPVPPPEELAERLLESTCITRSSAMVRRAAWDAAPPSAAADSAWDLELWLSLLATGHVFRRLDGTLVTIDYPQPWTQAERLRYLIATTAAYHLASEQEAPDSEARRARAQQAIAELLIFTRYQGLSRRERLSVMALPAARGSLRVAGVQLAAGLLPNATRHIRAELVNFRPRTTALDLLAATPLHDCSQRPSSLCQRGPLVTIAVTCFNYGRFLSSALESALRQSYSDIEVIVVDDGSTDDTPEVVAAFGDSIRSYRQENAGVAAARNFAAQMAHGEFLTYLDADDRFHPLYVQELLGAFCDRPDDRSLGFVYSQMQFFERDHRQTWYPEFDRAALGYGNYVNASALLAMAALRDSTFDASLGGLEDWDFFLTLVDRGWTGHLVDLPLLLYRAHSDSESRTDSVRSKERQRALKSAIAAKHPWLSKQPALRHGRMFDSYVRHTG